MKWAIADPVRVLLRHKWASAGPDLDKTLSGSGEISQTAQENFVIGHCWPCIGPIWQKWACASPFQQCVQGDDLDRYCWVQGDISQTRESLL